MSDKPTNCQRQNCQSGKPGKYFPVMKIMHVVEPGAKVGKQAQMIVPLRTCEDCAKLVKLEDIANENSLNLLEKNLTEKGLPSLNRTTAMLMFAEPMQILPAEKQMPEIQNHHADERRKAGFDSSKMSSYKPKPGHGDNPLLKYPRNDECFCGSKKKAKSCCLPRINPYLPIKEVEKLAKYMNEFRHNKLNNLTLPILEIR